MGMEIVSVSAMEPLLERCLLPECLQAVQTNSDINPIRVKNHTVN